MSKQKKAPGLSARFLKVFPLLLLLRWGLWLAAHLPVTEKALADLWNLPVFQAAAVRLSSGLPATVWTFLTTVLLGAPGLAAFCLAALGNHLNKRYAAKGMPSLSQLWYRWRHPTRPVVVHTIRRCYLRYVHNGAEFIADLSRDKQVSFPGTTLTVRLVQEEAQLFDAGAYIASLPPMQWFHSEALSFEFVPFRLSLPEYR